MIWKSIDLSKISFFKFIAYYFVIIFFYILIVFLIQKIFSFEKEFSIGVYICLVIQVLAISLKIFFLNKDWKSPITIQYIISGIAFLVNILALYILTLLAHNVIAISGFFITYFLHLKIVIILGYKLSSDSIIQNKIE